MSAPKRLSSLADVTGAAHRPTYEPARHGHGIVHLGIGVSNRIQVRPPFRGQE
jgi:fructuronate reductase